MKRTMVLVVLLLMCVAGTAAVVSAQSATSAWEKPLDDIAKSVIGPVALAAFLIAVAGFAIMWCMGYAGIGVAVGIVIGGAILGNADTIASWLGIGS